MSAQRKRHPPRVTAADWALLRELERESEDIAKRLLAIQKRYGLDVQREAPARTRVRAGDFRSPQQIAALGEDDDDD